MRSLRDTIMDAIDYNTLTGVFTWKSPDHRREVGSIAGSIGKQGYRYIIIHRVPYRAARLAWYITYGVWPREVDHINGDRGDDRLINLRDVTHSENIVNTKARTSHGEKNIYWRSSRKKWYVFVMRDYINKHIGCFNSLEEAVEARDTYLARRGEKRR